MIEAKRRDIGLGSFPTVSLAQARGLAATNRATVAEGRNPPAEKRETRERPLDIPAVPHGIRSSFRNWVEEWAETSLAVSKAALAHNIGNATQAAYMTSDLLEQRRELMGRWARFVGGEYREGR